MKRQEDYYCNMMFSIWCCNVKYSAIFIKEDNELMIKINGFNKEFYEKVKNNDISIIEALYEDSQITIINPFMYERSNYYMILAFDMLCEGFLLKDNTEQCINCFNVEFNNINGFDNKSLIDIFEDDNKIILDNNKDEHELYDGILEYINRMSIHQDNNYILERKFIFKKDYNTFVDISQCVKDIWYIKNLLSLFSKREISLKFARIYNNDGNEGILFINYAGKIISKEDIYKNPFLITYNDIRENLDNVVHNSLKVFERIKEILERYLDMIECSELPIINRFLTFTQLLEGFSREYYKNEIKEKCKQEKEKKKKISEFKCRLDILILNINSVYMFDKIMVDNINERIKDGRNYYTHSNTNEKYKELTRRELIIYSKFLEDVLLLNIYIVLGINIENISNSFKNRYYLKQIISNFS